MPIKSRTEQNISFNSLRSYIHVTRGIYKYTSWAKDKLLIHVNHKDIKSEHAGRVRRSRN